MAAELNRDQGDILKALEQVAAATTADGPLQGEGRIEGDTTTLILRFKSDRGNLEFSRQASALLAQHIL